MSETSPLLEVDTTLERGPGGLRAERRFWPGCCEHSSSQLPFGPPTRQTLQMATARMYPDGVQHFWSLLARTIGALEARFLEFWDGGVGHQIKLVGARAHFFPIALCLHEWLV